LEIRGDIKQTAEFLFSDYLIDNLERQVIWQHPQQGLIVMNSKSRGLHEKHAVATWNLGTISAFA
jgi:hypothetical protein